jgi:starch phosphorylase
MAVRAFVSLDGLSPDEVDVQVAYGRVSTADLLADVSTSSLRHAESYEGGRHRFEGEVELRRTGPFGFTVRVLPRHAGLASPAELGLVINA